MTESALLKAPQGQSSQVNPAQQPFFATSVSETDQLFVKTGILMGRPEQLGKNRGGVLLLGDEQICSRDSLATCTNNLLTMTSDEVDQGQTCKLPSSRTCGNLESMLTQSHRMTRRSSFKLKGVGADFASPHGSD